MFIYLFIVFFCWILSQSKLKKSQITQSLFAIFLIIFLCFGYMTGSDWRSYEKWYEWGIVSILLGGYKEPGYHLYSMFFKFIGVSFWPYFIFTKTVLFLIIFRFVKRLYPNNIFQFWMYFLPWFGFFLFIDNPARNAIAVGIFLLSFKYLINRSLAIYLVFTLFAMSFHASAIIMIPLYYLANRGFKSKSLIIIFIIVNIIFSSQEVLRFLITSLFSKFPFIDGMISRAFGRNIPGSLISFGLILHILLFFILLSYRNSIVNNLKFGKQIFNLAILYPLFFRMGLTMQPLARFQLFLAVFFVIAIISIVYFLNKKKKNYYIIFLLLVSLIACKNIMSNKYVPYTNYLTYIFSNEYPSYEYRDSFNPDNSPYSQ